MLKKLLIFFTLIFCIVIVLAVIKKPAKNIATSNNNQEKYFKPGDYNLTLEHDGLIRKYRVHLPPQYDSENKLAVILAFHGFSGNSEEAPDFFELDAKSDNEGFIVIYPEGTGITVLGRLFGSWNVWNCCNPARKNNIDDIGFIRKLISKIEVYFEVDNNRIYATGMSNGSQLSYKIGCELSDKIAAIAPVSSMDYSQECSGEPVPIISFQGTKDKCSLWEGGDCGKCSSGFVDSLGGVNLDFGSRQCLSIEDYVDKWRKRNGCSEEKEIVYQNNSATCYAYKNCLADMTFCKIEGMGHAWPGRNTPSSPSCKKNPAGLMCQRWIDFIEGTPNVDISANDMMWDFFKNHPKTRK